MLPIVNAEQQLAKVTLRQHSSSSCSGAPIMSRTHLSVYIGYVYRGANPIQDSHADIQSSPWWCTTVSRTVHLYCWCPWSTSAAFSQNQSAACASS